MGIIQRIKANFYKYPRAYGIAACAVGMSGAFGWRISCGIVCVIILNQFLTRD